MSRILIVDDELPIRQLLRNILEQAGYDVMDAANGEEAIRAASDRSIDLLITDLIMPEIEGIELIHYFRKSPNYVKVIAISGVGAGQYLNMARVVGADAVLPKPFAREQLLTVVASLVTR